MCPNRETEFLAEDIETQRKRIGGNFVIARAIGSREERDHIRSMLPDCIFIILSMTKEYQMKRIVGRHGEDKSAQSVVKFLNGLRHPRTRRGPLFIN